MKVAMVQPRISYYNGGGEKNPMRLMLALAMNTDITIELYTLKSPISETKNYIDFKNKVDDKIKIFELEIPYNYNYLYDMEPGESRYRWNTESLFFNSLIMPLLTKSSYDLLWSFYNYDAVIHPQDRPSILNLLGYPHTKVPHEKALIDQFTATVSISSNVAKMWEKQLDTKLRNNYVTSPAVDTKEVSKTDGFFNKEHINIVYVGRLIERKGLEILIRSIPLLLTKNKNIELHVLGDGPFKNRIKEVIKELKINDRVHLLGYKEDVSDYYVNADVCVFPSIEGEGLMGTVLETMGCGGVVVTTTNNGNEEIIDNMINGVLVEPGDSEILADVINNILDNPKKADEIRINAREKARNKFTWKNQVIEIEKIIHTVCNEFPYTER